MNEIIELVREFGYPILVLYGVVTLVGFGIFVWFAKKIFDSFNNFDKF